jgi:hypothetical protein
MDIYFSVGSCPGCVILRVHFVCGCDRDYKQKRPFKTMIDIKNAEQVWHQIGTNFII